jgi:hypothetical protein
MVSVPGPLMLKETDSPVSTLVTVARARPANRSVTVPFGAVVDRMMYWLKSTNSMWTAKFSQKPDAGRSTGTDGSGMRGSAARAGAAKVSAARAVRTATNTGRQLTR